MVISLKFVKQKAVQETLGDLGGYTSAKEFMMDGSSTPVELINDEEYQAMQNVSGEELLTTKYHCLSDLQYESSQGQYCSAIVDDTMMGTSSGGSGGMEHETDIYNENGYTSTEIYNIISENNTSGVSSGLVEYENPNNIDNNITDDEVEYVIADLPASEEIISDLYDVPNPNI
eukprot:Pgem_evm2s3885